VHVVGRGRIEVQTASGYLGVAIEGVLAEHYRKVISEKTRDALARLRMNGRRVSRWAPYGFTFAADGRVIEEPSEQAALTTIGALGGSGASLRAISVELAACGILARSGRPFAPSTLLKLVRNRAVVNTEGAARLG
jgi:DNA invertase Pin-like site-specific DNA recombinase